MERKKIILLTEEYVKKIFSGEGSGHDWWHIFRVWHNAKTISKGEPDADMLVVELAALLHDVADRKFNDENVQRGVDKVHAFLLSISVEQQTIVQVCEIIKNCSYASSFLENGKRKIMETVEGKIVQDADRLDALGAIGIARAFAYGGHKNRELYNPDKNLSLATTTQQYTQGSSHTIHHFYEKLLLLKDMMNTQTAKKMAEKRHLYMQQFLEEFYSEWNEGI